MSIYKHEQKSSWSGGTPYKSYRVAVSVDGKVVQKYFPRTRKGYQDAKKCEDTILKEQAKA